MKTLQQKIGYDFKNQNLLKQALTHTSVEADVNQNYERLEFVGDRVLGLVVAEILYQKFSDEPEGDLAQRHVALVCKETVALVARNLDVQDYMLVANEDLKQNESVLCDVGEAIIGAIFIDAGYEYAKKFVADKWNDLIDVNKEPPKDNKTHLQEEAHVKGLGVPVYEEIAREGLEHKPIFHVKVKLANGLFAVGEGKNKKMAEFDAAGKMLKRI